MYRNPDHSANQGNQCHTRKEFDSHQISVREFFDFLSCAFKSRLDPEEKTYYNELLNNKFVTKLLELSVEKFECVDADGKVNDPERRKQNDPKLEDDRMRGIRSLYIRLNKRPNDPDFSFSHLPILEAENILKKKLQEVIDEGILDSMFPFLISKFNSALNGRLSDEIAGNEVFQHKTNKVGKQKPRKIYNPEAEIEIQVCDEVNNVSKNFRCSQSLLLSKMEYFAEVTEGQRLEDMDISVHCDITIFEWLMKWVHRSTKELTPSLNINNVTPVLISAMFLRMEPLVDECVKYFKQNLKDIIEINSSFSCLSDSILEKIADTLSNVELDVLEDPQDKIQSKLFTKFILSLSRRRIDKEKGHYSSLASLFRCIYCKQILHEDSGSSIPCTSEFLVINAKGNIQGRHKEDTGWNLNSYIKQLKRELSTWKNVYWKLWGTCHYLDCSKCQMSYALTHSLCCRYHPNGAHFGIRPDSANLLVPIGRYMCCGARTHKFDVLGLPSGCMYKAHVPAETNISTILSPILERKRAAICFCPSETMLEEEKDPHNLSGSNVSWWPISMGNYFDKLHLFNDILGVNDDEEDDSDNEDESYEGGVSMKNVLEEIENISSESDFNDTASVGDGEDSDVSFPSKKCDPKPKSQVSTKLWTTHRSIRFNQDNQREREERIIKTLLNKLNRNKTDEFDIFISRNELTTSKLSEGGVYPLLEEEWREETTHPELLSATAPSPGKSAKSQRGSYNYL